jgi:5'-nucleotidase
MISVVCLQSAALRAQQSTEALAAAVTQIELGDLARGYHTIDISDKSSTNLYSVACNLYFGLLLISISRKAGVPLVAKKNGGTPIKSRAEALPERPQSGPYLLPPKGTIEEDQAVHGAGANSSMEIKEWQAVMDYLRTLPKKDDRRVCSLLMDDRAAENRTIDLRV